MAARRPPGKRMRRGMQPAANVRLKPPIKNGCGLPADEARSVPGGRRTTTTMTGTGVIAGEGSETLRHKHGARRRVGGGRDCAGSTGRARAALHGGPPISALRRRRPSILGD